MEKYKLVGQYPERKKGDVAFYNPNKCMNNFIWESDGKSIPRDFQPDVTPDWFEKISYKILSFINQSGDLFNISEDGNFRYKSWDISKFFTEYDLIRLVEDTVFIHSVQRFSDGEIFTIGDKIISYKTVKEIVKINIPQNTKNDIGFTTKKENICINGYQYLFEDKVEKFKQSLFTTEDCVDVYEGDSWFYVAEGHTDIRKTNTLIYLGTSCKTVKSFSTQKAAEDWIRTQVKPNFVTEDGVKIFPKSKYWALNIATNSLWEATCQFKTEKNKGVQYFADKENAKQYYIENAHSLSLKDVASIYVSATKQVTETTHWNAQNKRIQELVLSKLTQF